VCPPHACQVPQARGGGGVYLARWAHEKAQLVGLG
jgi:hypothetical protein